MRFAAAVILFLCLTGPALAGEPVEEVLAEVSGTPILRSDLELAWAVALLERTKDESEAAYRDRLLETRINLELQLRDIEESGALYKIEVEVGPSLELLSSRLGGAAEIAPRLTPLGLTVSDLEELALRLAAANAYVEQRLRPTVVVDPEELETAYEQLFGELSSADRPPLATVRDQVQSLLVQRKLNAEIESWLEQARQRHEVVRFDQKTEGRGKVNHPISRPASGDLGTIYIFRVPESAVAAAREKQDVPPKNTLPGSCQPHGRRRRMRQAGPCGH